MLYLYALSWLSLIVQSLAFTFSIGAGLYYLAEVIEEYASTAKKLINLAIVVTSLLAIGLIFFEQLPLKMTLIVLISNLLYFVSLKTFPFIDIYSPVFISSIILLVIQHYISFSFFSENYYQFYEIITYFTLFCWLIPILLLMSLSANDNVLPMYGTATATKQQYQTFSNDLSNDTDLVSNYFNQKSKSYGLLSGLRFIRENYLPMSKTRKNY